MTTKPFAQKTIDDAFEIMERLAIGALSAGFLKTFKDANAVSSALEILRIIVKPPNEPTVDRSDIINSGKSDTNSGNIIDNVEKKPRKKRETKTKKSEEAVQQENGEFLKQEALPFEEGGNNEFK